LKKFFEKKNFGFEKLGPSKSATVMSIYGHYRSKFSTQFFMALYGLYFPFCQDFVSIAMGSLFFVIRSYVPGAWPTTGCIVYVSQCHAKAQKYATSYDWQVPSGCIYICEQSENEPLGVKDWERIKDRYDYK